MRLFNREPAVILGIIAAVVLAVVQTLVGKEVLSPDLGKLFESAIGEGGWLWPILLGIITRYFVFSPKSAAELKAEVPPGYVPAGAAIERLDEGGNG